jgi:hypothetical protein
MLNPYIIKGIYLEAFMSVKTYRYLLPFLVLALVTLSCGIVRVEKNPSESEKNPPVQPAKPQEEQPAAKPSVQPEPPGGIEKGGLLSQWAITATASSAFGDPGWAAEQAIGKPNVMECGDDTSAWASLASDSVEWIELGYSIPVRPTLINIHQSYSPDQVVLVELKEPNGKTHKVYDGEPQKLIECPYILSIPLAEDYLVDGVKITVDQSKLNTSWNEIDAVELVGFEDGSAEAPPAMPPTDSEFPIPNDAKNIQNIGNTTNLQTKLSLSDAMGFYRQSFSKIGITEDKTYTSTSETTFSMVFTGDSSGKKIVVQGVDLGSGSTNISLRKE